MYNTSYVLTVLWNNTKYLCKKGVIFHFLTLTNY